MFYYILLTTFLVAFIPFLIIYSTLNKLLIYFLGFKTLALLRDNLIFILW